MGQQFGVQTFAAVATAIYTLIVSFVILKSIDAISGLRVDEDTETRGLDLGEHGEGIGMYRRRIASRPLGARSCTSDRVVLSKRHGTK